MKDNDLKTTTDRRRFIGSIASGAAALGIATFTPALNANAGVNNINLAPEDPDAWFNQVKGKHRIVFDCTEPKGIFPFAWPRVFLLTNAATGSPESDCGIVVILRHEAIPYAFEDSIWSKYKFGEVYKIDDSKTKAPSVRNPFWKPQKGEYTVPGVGEVQIGINELQASAVMFCVCSVAMTVSANMMAGKMKMDAADILKDWNAGLLPGIQVVPSGVWAVGRAQEHGCQYCFVG